MKPTKLIFFLIISAIVIPGSLAAGVGTLSLEKGMVRLRRLSKDTIYRKPGLKITVNNKDEIQTGNNTRVKIILDNQVGDIELFSQTFFIITAVTKDASDFTMLVGKGKFVLPKILKQKKRTRRLRLRTTNALIGVKGSGHITGSDGLSTSVLVLSGIVTMASIAEPEVEVQVKINQASQVRQNTRPTVPVTVPPSIRQNIISADTPKVFKEVKFGAVISAVKVKKDSKKQPPKEKKSVAPAAKPGGKKDVLTLPTAGPAAISVGLGTEVEPTEPEAIQIETDEDLDLDDDPELPEDIDFEDEIDAINDSIEEINEEVEQEQTTIREIKINIVNP